MQVVYNKDGDSSANITNVAWNSLNVMKIQQEYV